MDGVGGWWRPCRQWSDVEGNGQVEANDLTEFVGGQQLTDDDPGWDPHFDLNGTG
jgi:hypothetical protein